MRFHFWAFLLSEGLCFSGYLKPRYLKYAKVISHCFRDNLSLRVWNTWQIYKRLKYFPLSTLKSYQIISKLRSEFNVLFITSLFSLVNKTSLLTSLTILQLLRRKGKQASLKVIHHSSVRLLTLDPVSRRKTHNKLQSNIRWCLSCLRVLCDWPWKSRQLFNQSGANFKAIGRWSPAFSRASGRWPFSVLFLPFCVT